MGPRCLDPILCSTSRPNRLPAVSPVSRWLSYCVSVKISDSPVYREFLSGREIRGQNQSAHGELRLTNVIRSIQMSCRCLTYVLRCLANVRQPQDGVRRIPTSSKTVLQVVLQHQFALRRQPGSCTKARPSFALIQSVRLNGLRKNSNR